MMNYYPANVSISFDLIQVENMQCEWNIRYDWKLCYESQVPYFVWSVASMSGMLTHYSISNKNTGREYLYGNCTQKLNDGWTSPNITEWGKRWTNKMWQDCSASTVILLLIHTSTVDAYSEHMLSATLEKIRQSLTNHEITIAIHLFP